MSLDGDAPNRAEEPITELPILEAHLWEGFFLCELEGNHEQSVEFGEMLKEFGYDLGWEELPVPHGWLRHQHTGQMLRWARPDGPIEEVTSPE